MFSERTCETPFGFRTEYLSGDEVIYAEYFDTNPSNSKRFASLRMFASYIFVFGIAFLMFFIKRG